MITIDHVSKHYPGARRAAVSDVSLELPDGIVTALIGPSGCGKSTTLRMVNRLVEPDSGAVYLDGINVADLRPEDLRRQLGYAIQGVGLFPHWTVAQNIGTVPRLLGWERGRIDVRPIVAREVTLSQASAELRRFNAPMPPGVAVITDFTA